MKKLPFDYDPLTKTTQFLHVDQDGSAVLESIQDVDDIFEYNKAKADLLDRKKDMWFIGTIPNSICLKWAQESGTRIYSKEWVEVAKKNLMLPENSKMNPNRIKL
jgi:hypothetical protein